MSQLARAAPAAAIDSAVEDQPAADACADFDIRQIGDAAACAVATLAQRAHISVVAQIDWHHEFASQDGLDIHPIPSWHARWPDELAQPWIQRTRNPNADANDPVPGDLLGARKRAQLGDEMWQAGSSPLIGVEWAGAARDHCRREVREQKGEVAAANIHTYDIASV